MIVRIDHTNFQNKGAELMLQAIVRRLRAERPGANLVYGRGEPDPRRCAELGILRASNDKVAGIRLHHVLPEALLRRRGAAHPDRADVVLDAAGYLWGDAWVGEGYTPSRNEKLRLQYSRLKKRGARLVLMPQALGPFEKPLSAERFKIVADTADLIYAREKKSLAYAQGVLGKDARLRLCPDFTNLCKPTPEDGQHVVKGAFVVIPNVRMVTHTEAAVAGRYERFMTEVATEFARRGRPVVLLNHGGREDGGLCQKIAGQVGGTFVDPSDAMQVKAVIGAAEAVVSSRFHGVISALAQGVPAYCTSWSHKYPLAYEDYGVEPCLLDIKGSRPVAEQLAPLTDDAARGELKARIVRGTPRLEAAVREMWREVDGILDAGRR